MAETSSGGVSGFLYFIVGALVVIVGLGAYAYFGGYVGGHTRTTTTEQTTTAPAAPGSSTTTTTKSTTTKTTP